MSGWDGVQARTICGSEGAREGVLETRPSRFVIVYASCEKAGRDSRVETSDERYDLVYVPSYRTRSDRYRYSPFVKNMRFAFGLSPYRYSCIAPLFSHGATCTCGIMVGLITTLYALGTLHGVCTLRPYPAVAFMFIIISAESAESMLGG